MVLVLNEEMKLEFITRLLRAAFENATMSAMGCWVGRGQWKQKRICRNGMRNR